MTNLVVVSTPQMLDLLKGLGCEAQLATAEDYLKDETKYNNKSRVYNLCNDYTYCKRGYYVSLLAEARQHRPLPSVQSVSDINNKVYLKLLSEALLDSLNKVLKDIKADEFEISVYFGKNMAQKYAGLAKQVFSYFQVPLIRVFCAKRADDWFIKSVKLISLKDVPDIHYPFLVESMNEYFGYPQSVKKANFKSYKYDIAILFNPEDEMPPSDKGAIELFIKAAKDLRMSAEVIGAKDISNIGRFDGLFIRETTNILDHTFRYAKRAEIEGLVVIDDSQSMIRCCNKVFLHDLLTKKGVATPKTQVLYKGGDLAQFNEFPLVIKKPDSAFSTGVKKVNNLEELEAFATEYFKKSDLLIAQEFIPTDFDWRVGIIDGVPLYACKYYMTKNNWQIISRNDGKTSEGRVETFSLHDIPEEAIDLALKACKAIGNSLYGVDIKEKNGKFYCIEVNDNPSLEKGCEDKVIGHKLYRRIMQTFYDRIEAR